MAKVLTLQGAADQPPVNVVLDWDWKHVVGAVLGVAAIVGGGVMAVYGYSKHRRTLMWSGVGTAGGGVLLTGTCFLLNYLRRKAITGGALPADTHPPEVKLSGAPPMEKSTVLLGDGQRARVDHVSPLPDGSKQLAITVIDGMEQGAEKYVSDREVKVLA